MSPELVATIGKETIITILMVGSPILITGMIVGLLISIFQSVTQIHEMTLSFVPKIIIVLASVIAFGPWMIRVYMDFTSSIITNIPTYIR